MWVDGIRFACYYYSKGIIIISKREHAMSKVSRKRELAKEKSKKILKKKENARIGFLESTGNSGYENRTDPNYCFDILKKFMKKKESSDTDLG